ncbi:hypothetical protein D3C77_414150 [compost metagenome]
MPMLTCGTLSLPAKPFFGPTAHREVYGGLDGLACGVGLAVWLDGPVRRSVRQGWRSRNWLCAAAIRLPFIKIAAIRLQAFQFLSL